jgi:N-acetylmuramoyl-L-alanine amidase
MKNLNQLRLGLLLISLTVGFSLAFVPDLFADKKNYRESGVRTIVIDPGHGGHDSGCHGAGAYEKNVALAVSLKLGKLIEDNFSDIKVIYTRKTDVFVELYQRAQIANDSKADLFICIHCNSGPKAAFGAETFVMGLHKSDDNLNVAKRENAVILQEDNYQRKYDGFDPNSAEANIIFSLYQNAFLDQSLYFADRLQHEFKHHASRHNRGVKQAGFLVLYRTTMPSVLIETGFLTNGEEEKFLKSSAGQQKIANSILRALNTYKSWIEGSSEHHDLKIPKDEEQVNQNNEKHDEQTTNAQSENISINKTEKESDNSGIVFRIQVYTSPEKISLNSPRFKGRSDVWEYKFNKNWKYTIGSCDKQEDALKLLTDLKKAGFDDAFVVAFKNNVRISLQEAQLIQPN